jgi:hypothetical protein
VSVGGHLAAVSGTHDGKTGIWVVDLASGATTLALDGDYGPVSFSGDGSELAVVRESSSVSEIVKCPRS